MTDQGHVCRAQGACKNCGAMGHQANDCLERPRKKTAAKTGLDIAADDVVTNLSEHGKVMSKPGAPPGEPKFRAHRKALRCAGVRTSCCCYGNMRTGGLVGGSGHPLRETAPVASNVVNFPLRYQGYSGADSSPAVPSAAMVAMLCNVGSSNGEACVLARIFRSHGALSCAHGDSNRWRFSSTMHCLAAPMALPYSTSSRVFLSRGAHFGKYVDHGKGLPGAHGIAPLSFEFDTLQRFRSFGFT